VVTLYHSCPHAVRP